MKNTVIFDLDGTLLDTLTDLAASVNYALDTMGYPLRTKSEICSFVGNGVRLLVSRAVPENTSREDADKTFGIFSEYYAKHMNDTTRPYAGLCEVLAELKKRGYKTAVVSNKYDVAVKHLCKDFFGANVDIAVGESEKIKRKPAPDGVYAVLKELNSQKEQAVYVGDADTDFNTAKNAEVDFVGVSWGFRPRDLLISLGAKKVADTPRELLEILTEM